MLSRLDLRGVAELDGALPRPTLSDDAPLDVVRDILADVRLRGDVALAELSERFDNYVGPIRVDPDACAAARSALSPELDGAMVLARDRIEAFHLHQMPEPTVYASDGVTITSYAKPVGRAGCYVPGGRAAYPSTLLMTSIPAKVAGVDRISVCVPASPDTGEVAAISLAAAHVAGVDDVYAIGGAQAIAAMAFGTDSVSAVDVICGPGNKYVALAQQEVAGSVGIASAFAGPSEVVVIADGSVDPRLAAIDLVVQAEHGPDGLAWLICWSDQVADAVIAEVDAIVAAAPRRDEIAATLASSGHAVIVDSPEQAISVSDAIAPEHLELMCEGAESLASTVDNAGAIFCGPLSPASIGDYVAGPSHVLPTHGSARFASALTVADFLKQHHVVTASERAIDDLGPAVVALAEAEGLDAHAASIRLRLDDGSEQ